MKMKTLLLGTAAAVSFAASNAQAADLAIAEPVDYVRVCDAFGTGYWYIPGTDTCLRIGGFVRFETRFNDDTIDEEHDRSWEFFTRANLQVEARSMTDWGPLVSYFEFEGDFHDGEGAAEPTVEEAWLSLGPVTAGFLQSNFDWGGGYTYEGLDGFGAITDTKTNQIALSWAMNGFGIILAVEEGHERNKSWFGYLEDLDEDIFDDAFIDDAGSLTGDMPDLVAAITSEGAGWNAKLAFIYAPQDDDDGDDSWGVQGGVEFDVFGEDKFMLAASYLDVGIGGVFFDDSEGDVLSVNSMWSILASYQHFWQSNLYSAVTLNYSDFDDLDNAWAVAFTTGYSPVENFEVGGEIVYTDFDNEILGDSNWTARIRLQRDFGG